MPKKDKSRLRIIWAVDAYGERNEAAPNGCVRALNALARQIGAEIEPVYVLSLGRSAGMTLGLPKTQPYLSRADEALRKSLKMLRVPATLSPRIVMTGGDSSSVCAQSLARHARSEGADMIVVCSHARKGIARLFLGSFAESLMLWTPAPLLVVNPETKITKVFKRVMFPTDFSDASRKAFRGLLGLAKRLKATIEVLHVLPKPLVEAGVHIMWENENFRVESERARRNAIKRAAVLVAEARRAGVLATATVKVEEDYSIPDTIIAAAGRSRAQMIAMAAQSRNWQAAFVGSVARQVVRGATCPVLILRDMKRSHRHH